MTTWFIRTLHPGLKRVVLAEALFWGDLVCLLSIACVFFGVKFSVFWLVGGGLGEGGVIKQEEFFLLF